MSAAALQRPLFDTNVLLDVLLRREAHLPASAQAWDAADQGHVEGVLVATTVTTIAYLVARAYDVTQARSDVEALLASFEVASVGEEELEDALRNGFRDYEDGVAHEAALYAGCSSIITRNGRDFETSQLPVYTPSEFVAALQEMG